MEQNTSGDLAATYASEYGWHILPVHGITADGRCTCGKPHSDPKEIGKHPASPNGQKDATTDLAQIQCWWTQNPNYNIGVMCQSSGFFAIDIDPRSGGDDSFITLEERAEGSIIPTVEAITGEYTVKGRVVRGRHLIYRCNPNESFMKNLDKSGLKGIDIKWNGYIVLTPSRHFSGVKYEWAPGKAPWEIEIAEAPEELLQALRSKAPTPAKTNVSSGFGAIDYSQLVASSMQNQPFDLAGTLADGLVEGERAVTVYQMACSMAARFGTDPLAKVMIVGAMKDYNATSITPPMQVEGSNGLLMHVRRAIEFVQNNPPEIHLPSTQDGKALSDTHDSAAMEWVAGYLKSSFCWNKYLGWLRYVDGVWKSRSDEAVREAIRKIIHKFWEDARRDPDLHSTIGALKSFLSKPRLSALEALLRGFLEVEDDVLDGHVDMLNAKNGVIDLKTGDLLPHDPSYYFTKQTICAYEPNAKHPDWNKALEAIPAYAYDYVHTLFGQGCTGFTLSEDIALVLGGGGSNGKSTICDLCLKVLGKFAVSVSSNLLTARDSDHTTEITDLVGKRFALLEEFPMGGSINVNRLKRIIGTTEITGRRMRQDNQTWEATHTMVMTTNSELNIPSGDGGTWRRLVKINFPYRFVAKPELPNDRQGDQGLRIRLNEGKEGQHEAVLAWLVQGAINWFANDRKLPKLPKEVQADIDEWRASQDSLGSFLKDTVELDSTSWVTQADLHQMFKIEHGAAELEAEKAFNSALKSHEFIVSNGLKVSARQRTVSKAISRPNPLGNPWLSTSSLAIQTTLIKGLRFKN